MDTKFTILLNSIEHVKTFANSMYRFQSDLDLVSGRYVIDAKSIMGIFSLDLSKPLELLVHGEDEVDAIREVIEPFLVNSSES